MKKLLFCAGILALAASCTENELVSTSMQQQAAATEGITFTATTNSPATRGEFVNVDGGYVPFWSSDPGTDGEDKIRIFSTLTDKQYGEGWNSTDYGVVYKATKSQRRGEFTGINEDNILNFIEGVGEDKPAQFIAIFPSTLNDGGTSALTPNSTTGVVTYKAALSSSVINLAAQTQKNTKGAGIFSNNIMYSATTGYPRTGEYGESIAGVGENLNLNFNYVFSGVAFRTLNVDDYVKYFGNLKTVTLESVGEPKSDGTYDATKVSKFIPGKTSTNPSLTVTVKTDLETREILSTEATLGMGDNASSKATVTMKDNDGLEWSDDARAYMMVAPIKRTAAEAFRVVYEFANIKFTTEPIATSNSWTEGVFNNFPALDIESYPYLLVKDANTNVYTLIVNKNGLAKALTNGKVDWDFDGDGEIADDGSESIAPANIANVIINGDMGTADWTAFQAFTGVAELTLNDVTTIPANGFAGLSATTVNVLNLPEVTEIAENFRGTTGTAFTVLTDLNLASYEFPEDAINVMFFNNGTKGSLANLDISGVTSMAPTFNVNRTLKFEGYTLLKTVKANPTKVDASQNAFDGCIALESVTGVFDLTKASYAFRNAGNAAAKLTKVNVATDIIPANAFYGASNVKEILLNGKQVAPTTIGEYALAGTAIEYMDLSKATTIGKNALAGTSSYKGVEKNNPLVEINAAVLEDCILQGTSVVNVRFNNATQLNGNVFANVTTLGQVEFVKAFTIAKKVKSEFQWYETFGKTPSNIDLFLNAEQEYLSADGKSLVFPYYTTAGKEDTTNDPVTFTFGQVM